MCKGNMTNPEDSRVGYNNGFHVLGIGDDTVFADKMP